MLHNILAWLGVIEHKSFENITSGLTKMVDDLLSLASFHGLQTVSKDAKVNQLIDEITSHKDEAQKAIAVATKIGGLLA